MYEIKATALVINNFELALNIPVHYHPELMRSFEQLGIRLEFFPKGHTSETCEIVFTIPANKVKEVLLLVENFCEKRKIEFYLRPDEIAKNLQNQLSPTFDLLALLKMTRY